MIWEESLKALRAAIAEDCAAEMVKTHGVALRTITMNNTRKEGICFGMANY